MSNVTKTIQLNELFSMEENTNADDKTSISIEYVGHDHEYEYVKIDKEGAIEMIALLQKQFKL